MDHGNSRLRDALALTFASIFPLVIGCFYFLVFDDPESPATRLTYGVGKVIQFSFPIAFVWWFEREQIRLTRPTWHGMPLAIGFSVIVAIAMFALYFGVVRHIPAVQNETPEKIHGVVKRFRLDSPLGYLAMGVFLSGIHSLAEEYYWRWFVFGWMRRHMPVALAIVLSGLGFMLHHVVVVGVYFPSNFWTLALPLSFCVAFGGGVWAWIYARSGTLYAPWASHTLIDAAIFGLGYVMLERYWA